MSTVFVNVASHRARERLKAALGYEPRCFYKGLTSSAPGPHYAYEIRREDLGKARTIKGVTQRRDSRDLRPCIKF